MKRVTVLLVSLLCVGQALATTYVRVEKDGSKTYSDRPLSGGQPVDLQPAQTYSAPPAGNSSSSAPREQQLLREMQEFRYTSCRISPKNDETFTNPPAVNIIVTLDPPLRAGDIVDLKLDGVSVAGQNPLAFTAAQPFRGSHTVSLSVKDRYGNTVCSSTSTFHVMRPSLNSPARRAAG